MDQSLNNKSSSFTSCYFSHCSVRKPGTSLSTTWLTVSEEVSRNPATMNSRTWLKAQSWRLSKWWKILISEEPCIKQRVGWSKSANFWWMKVFQSLIYVFSPFISSRSICTTLPRTGRCILKKFSESPPQWIHKRHWKPAAGKGGVQMMKQISKSLKNHA